jgi:hypothetical protein
MKRIGVGSAAGKLAVFSAELSRCFKSIQLPVWDRTQAMEFFPDAQSIVCSEPSSVRRYSVPDGAELARIPFDSPTGMVIEQGGASMVVAGTQGVVRTPLGPHTKTEALLPPTRGYWEGLVSSADGQWLAVSDPTLLRIALWKAIPAPFEPRIINVSPIGPSGLALSPDGKTIAVTHQYDPGILIIDAASGEITLRLDIPPQHDIAWSPDGRLLAASGSTAQMWDTQTWSPLALPPTTANVTPAGACVFAPVNNAGQSAFLAVALNSTRIQLIDLPSRTTRATLQSPHGLPIVRMKISKDGRWLGVGASRGRIQLWDVPAIESSLRAMGLEW